MDMGVVTATLVFLIAGRPGLRLHQRLARCGQLDRNGRFDARAEAAVCGDLGRFFNFAAYFVFGVHVANTVGKG
jgi:hypothetical protein